MGRWALALLGLLAGCFISPDPRLWQGARDGQPDRVTDGPASDRPLTDGASPEARADTGPGPDSPPGCDWSGTVTLTAPVHLDALSSPSTDSEPMLSADGLTLYFASTRGGGYDSFTATRASTGDPFGNVTKNLEVSTDTDSETRLALTADGLEAFLTTNRTGGQGGSDIWAATRSSTSTAFSPTDFQPVDVLNSALNEWDPYPSTDGLRLYYIIQDWPSGLGDSDIVVASRASRSDSFSSPVAVGGVNTSANEDNPAVTADERVMVFGSNRPGGTGGKDIYYAVRPDASSSFSTPKPVPGLNTADNDAEIYITPDGCEIYFASDRPGGQGGWDLYYTKWSP